MRRSRRTPDLYGLPVVFTGVLGETREDPIDFKIGPCRSCGRQREYLVVNYIDRTWAGETCRSCAEKLNAGLLPVRIRQTTGLDTVTEARLTTDPE